jgi:hypothetical protein
MMPPSCVVEVALPMRLSAKWVAYACRTAGVAKPKWSPIHEVWTSATKAADGIEESIAITSWGERGIRVKVEWSAPADRETPTARRVITAVVTAMQWQMRQRVIAAPDSQLQLR